MSTFSSSSQGPKGDEGKSAYEIWKTEVAGGKIEWPGDKTEISDFFGYLKGEKGETGKSAYEMWKEMISSGNVPNPHNPSEMWSADRDKEVDFWDYLTGRDGNTPHVGDNGNWWIGDVDLNITAVGKDGKDGQDGRSAYENWKELVEQGVIDWPSDKTTELNFFEYLKGKDGQDGQDGKPGQDGKDGKDGITPHIGDNGNWYIGSKDTGIPAQGGTGSAGAAGENGKSAYEMWVEDVKDGKITDKSGNPWPTDEVDEKDFYRYLSGKDGKDGIDGNDGQDGRSAYDIWKEMAESGNLDDPKNPGQKWPADKVSEADFFDYLRGKDGEDGEDGKDGQDGKPGEPGRPGATVTVVAGVPNVIAQYSQAEYGEYVRTSDGGVLFKVYDKTGAVAPAGAIVQGLPGMDASKSYTTNASGEFIVPKEDLPNIEDVNIRWGKTASVTIAGETLESAKNTYVPNRVHMRMVTLTQNGLPGANHKYNWLAEIEFAVQRKTSPDSEWQSLPSYLPQPTGGFKCEAWLCDENDPTNMSKKIYNWAGTYVNGEKGITFVSFNTTRFISKDGNYTDDMNKQDEYWDGVTEMYYFTVKCVTPYYGETFNWNGVCDLPPYQMSPTIKKIVLRKASTGVNKTFESSTTTLDFSKFNFNIIYDPDMVVNTTTSGMELLRATRKTDIDALKADKAFSIRFGYTVPSVGWWEINTDGNKASFDSPTTNTASIYLNTSMDSRNAQVLSKQWYMGKIKEDATGNYYFEKANALLPDVEVVYEP